MDYLYTTFISVLILVFAFFIYKYKLPILCYGCESPAGLSKYIFRCVVDSSKDSDLCKITDAIDTGNFEKMVGQIWNISYDAYTKITESLPETIKNAFNNITIRLYNLIPLVMEQITDFINNLEDIFSNIYKTMKNVVIKTSQQLIDVIIGPIMDKLMGMVVIPINLLINELVNFITILSTAIQNAVGDVSGIFINVKNKFSDVLLILPNSIEDLFNKLIDAVDTLARESVGLLNKGIAPSVQGINTAIREISKGINTGIRETVKGLNTGIGGINTGLNKTVDGLNTAADGIEGATNKVVDGLNTVVNGAVNPILGAVNKILEGWGTIRNASIPELKIPALKFPGIEWGKVFPGAGTSGEKEILPETKIFPEWKPFGGLPAANPVSWNGVNINKVDIGAIPPVSIPSIPGGGPNDRIVPEITAIPEKEGGKYIDDPPSIRKVAQPLNNLMNNFKSEVSKGISKATDPLYDAISKPIQEAYDKVMAPLISVIITLIQMYFSIYLMYYYILFTFITNNDFIMKLMNELQKGGTIILSEIKDSLYNNIWLPIKNILEKTKDVVFKVYEEIKEIIFGVFKDILSDLTKLFGVITDVLYEVGGVLLKNIGYTIYYGLSKLIDIAIPLPVQKTVKINLVVFVVLLYLIFQVKLYLDNWMLTLTAAALLLIMALTFGSGETTPTDTSPKPKTSTAEKTTTRTPRKTTAPATTTTPITTTATTETISGNPKIETYMNLNMKHKKPIFANADNIFKNTLLKSALLKPIY